MLTNQTSGQRMSTNEPMEAEPLMLQPGMVPARGDVAGRLASRLLADHPRLGDHVRQGIYRGMRTGLDAAFLIDHETRTQLLVHEPAYNAFIKPLARGSDVRAWHLEDAQHWVLLLPHGWTRATFGSGLSVAQAWQRFHTRYPPIARHFARFAAATQPTAPGQYWWELPAQPGARLTTAPKIIWPRYAAQPRVALTSNATCAHHTSLMIPGGGPEILGLLTSRVHWWLLTRLGRPTPPPDEQQRGQVCYNLAASNIARLPWPAAPAASYQQIGNLATDLTQQTNARYDLHHDGLLRLVRDLAPAGTRPGPLLARWWEYDFRGLRDAVQHEFNSDIPAPAHYQWEGWLARQRLMHEEYTARIVRLAGSLNANVYKLFSLNPEEIALIEASTVSTYGVG